MCHRRLAALSVLLIVAGCDYAERVPPHAGPDTATTGDDTATATVPSDTRDDVAADTGDGADDVDDDAEDAADAEVESDTIACTGNGECSGLDRTCRRGTCSEGHCVAAPADEDVGCDDGLKCTSDDKCHSGECAGTPVACPAQAVCDAAGTCDPETGACVRADAPDDKVCDDGLFCTFDDKCTDGVCGGTPRACADGPACTADHCDEEANACQHDPSACACDADADCDDHDPCSGVETCDLTSFTCIKGTPVDCHILDSACATGVCDAVLGCKAVPLADRLPCEDGDLCTLSDECLAGACKAGAARSCAAADDCHLDGACNPTDGQCSVVAKDDGAECDDHRACTTGDSCESGKCGGDLLPCDDGLACSIDACDDDLGGCVADTSTCECEQDVDCDDANPCNGVETCNAPARTCVAGTAVDCHELDGDCVVGVCQPASGDCASQPRANGLGCDDGDACAGPDSCQSGVCVGRDDKVCAAKDQCHLPGVCDSATGVCSDPARDDGDGCDDGDACTRVDTCASGACVGGSAVSCSAKDVCHAVGVCNKQTGVCTDPAGNEGGNCNDGSLCTQTDKCQNGNCVGSSPVSCAASDQCHAIGVCDPQTGLCSDPERIDGSPCEDGSPCTLSDKCAGGECASGAPKVCVAPACGIDAHCDTGNGACVFGTAENGADCDDQNGCTLDDECSGGTCSGAPAPACTAADQCHNAGTCNPATGVCSSPNKGNGVACTAPNCMRATCQAGNCQATAQSLCLAGESCQSDACACDPTAVSFANDVQPIFTTKCATATCHGGNNPDAGLDLRVGHAYGETVNVDAAECTGTRVRVAPNDIANSYLMDKLLGVDMCQGVKMPSGSSLTAAQLATIGRWVCQGADND